jgi:nitroreductase
METIDCIKTRRSVRNYEKTSVDSVLFDTLIEAAICAPSGKNRQPWRFAVIEDISCISEISSLSGRNNGWIQNAPSLIAVFLDRTVSYDYIRDYFKT